MPEAGLTIAHLLGADRVIAPTGSLPQAADRLDAETPAGRHEVLLDVEELNLDATSYRQLFEINDGDPARMATAIADIVEARGKMQNPITGSGGVLVGQVRTVGDAFPSPRPTLGQSIVVLASLTTTPLRLTGVGPVDPLTPRVAVTGTAVLTPRMPWAPLPDDLPRPLALAALDVYSAASHTADLCRPDDRVLVLGAGRAGLLAATAARRIVGADGTVTAVDVSPAAVARATLCGAADEGVTMDLTDPVGAMQALEDAGLRPADLTVVCVNVRGCEASAALLTADTGKALFFSMATDFTRAALGAEAFSSGAQLLIGNGYAADRGERALTLLRGDPALRQAFLDAEGGGHA